MSIASVFWRSAKQEADPTLLAHINPLGIATISAEPETILPRSGITNLANRLGEQLKGFRTLLTKERDIRSQASSTISPKLNERKENLLLDVICEKKVGYYNEQISPLVQVIREQIGERVITRAALQEKGARAEALKQCCIPEEKRESLQGLLSFSDLGREILSGYKKLLPDKTDSTALTFQYAGRITDSRCVLTRKIPGQEPETLEYSFKQSGKVDVYHNGKLIGNLYHDDALKLATERFFTGKKIGLKPRTEQFQRFVVPERE